VLQDGDAALRQGMPVTVELASPPTAPTSGSAG